MFVVANVMAGVQETDLHWLAGLLEGEGSFMAGPPSNPRSPRLVVSMTDEDVIARAARLIGRKPCSWQAPVKHWKRTYMVRVTGARAVAWMTALRPLMGERRQAQIDRALACYDPRDNRKLTEATAQEALDLLEAGTAVREVADRFGTSVWCIYDLRHGRTHKYLVRRRE